MALPTRMQREAEEAEEFLSGLGATPEQPEVPEETTTPEPDPVPTAPHIPASPDPDLQREIARLQALLADENSPTYRHRYEVLAGKYNAEVPRLAEKIRELEAKLEAKPESPKQAAVATPEYEEAYNDLVEEHGPTTAKNILTIAESLAQGKYAELQRQFEEQLQTKLKPYDERVEQLAQTQAETAEERFFSTLDVLVPDWKTINGWGREQAQDPRFTKFLDQTVPGTDLTYNDILVDNYRRGNAVKVQEIFNIFKAGLPQAPPPNKGVEQYIDPSKTGKGTSPPDNQPKTYSHAQVEAFFDSRVKGTFRGTREEAIRLEAEYTQAMLEGRVR